MKKPQIGHLLKCNEEPLDHLFETNALKKLGLKVVDTGDKFQTIVSVDAIPASNTASGSFQIPRL